MELLPTLLGALPDLGLAGVVLIVLVVGQRILSQERAHFAAERTTYRLEANEDRAALRAELAELRAENRLLEERLDAERALRRGDPPTVRLPPAGG